MCSNAMLYNEDESDVFRDAQQIKVSHGLEYLGGQSRCASRSIVGNRR